MSSIQEPNLPSAGAPSRRTAPEAPVAPASDEQARPAADRLQALNRPEAPAKPGELVARIQAMQAGPEVPATVAERVRRRLEPEGVPHSSSDYLAPLFNLIIGVMTSPRYAVKKLQGAITRSFQLVRGVGKAREFARNVASARRQGQGLAFVRGQFRLLRWRTTVRARQAVSLARARKGRSLLQLFRRRRVAEVVNKGLLGFYREARAAGAGPLGALWRGFTRTIETGGNMPVVAEQAAKMGGRWGKLLTWTGRIGRLAPLLNVPLALFDIREAWNTFQHPDAHARDKLSKAGQAGLTTAAAGLAVAGFLTPPPLNAALLTACGVAGVASTLWGVATSDFATGIFQRVGGFFGGLGRRLGLG